MIGRLKRYTSTLQKRKNHPKVVYRILVTRSGIEPSTQGFSIHLTVMKFVDFPDKLIKSLRSTRVRQRGSARIEPVEHNRLRGCIFKYL